MLNNLLQKFFDETFLKKVWDRGDLNPGSPTPKAGMMAKLHYGPTSFSLRSPSGRYENPDQILGSTKGL